MDISNYLSFLIGIGLLGGNTIFYHSMRNTNKRALLSNNINPLDVYGDEESWWVLAQKYREYGTVKVGSERNFQIQKDPGFLDKEVWDYYVNKLPHKTTYARDDDIAKELKKQCKKWLNFDFEEQSYEKVKEWCVFKLPDYVKKILRWQKDNGGCRLWLVNSITQKRGWYPWEAVGKQIYEKKVGNKTYFEWLWDSLQAGYSVSTACKNKPNQIVPLSNFKKSVATGNETESIVWTALWPNQTIDKYILDSDSE